VKLLSSLRENDNWFTKALHSRAVQVHQVVQLWSSGDVSGCFLAMVHCRSPGLWNDVLKRVSLASEPVTLEHAVIVLPAIVDMLASACDE
jgi:hypothetical protein